MAALPAIQMRHQDARIGIDAEPGVMNIRQPKADLEIRTEPAVVSIRSGAGKLDIDQSRAWDALGASNILSTLDRIHSQARNVALDYIAQTAEKGDRLADLNNRENTLAELGKEVSLSFRELDYLGYASSGNVDINYTPTPVAIDVQTGGAAIHAEARKPEIQYDRGKLDIYVAQKAMLEITPPQIDIQV